MDVNTIINKKPSRVTEMQVGDTLFTVAVSYTHLTLPTNREV